MDKTKMQAPKCREEHGESFQLSKELHELFLAFLEQGSKYIKTGDVSLLTGMILLACNIAEHEEYDYVRHQLAHRNYGRQLEVLDFLAAGGFVFKDKISKINKKHKNDN